MKKMQNFHLENRWNRFLVRNLLPVKPDNGS